MAKGKYGFRIIEEDSSWTAQITRKISARKTGVSKSQKGFSSESEAKAWVDKELETFLNSLKERNKRQSQKREEATAKSEAESEAESGQSGETRDQ